MGFEESLFEEAEEAVDELGQQGLTLIENETRTVTFKTKIS